MAVDWKPGRVARQAAAALGLTGLDEGAFDKLVFVRWAEYRRLNQTRDTAMLDEFWAELGRIWLSEFGAEAHLASFRDAFWDALYGPNQKVFRLFDDTVPALDALAAKDVRLAVISNWDYSLHRVLKMLGIAERFELIVASLEEGVEKPEPELFHITLERLAAEKTDVLHVGDNPIDDFQGAKAFGLRAALLDRNHAKVTRPFIPSLMDIPEAFSWTS